jgi:trk system potassium uptake protein TrkH
MVLVYSFFVVAVVGALLLSMPAMNSTHHFISPVATFFTSVSAMTGTGLVVSDTREAFTGLGQAVIAGLIFVGGLGFMTGAAALLFLTGRRSSLQARMVIGAGLDDSRLGRVATLAKKIIIMAAVLQIIGAVFIFVRWYLFGPAWAGLSITEAIWQSTFTSISSFNNAGFDIIPDELTGGSSLVGFANDIPTLLIIGILILAGSTSYAVLANMAQVRGWRKLTLDSKLVLVGIGLMLLIGFITFLITEWNNPATIGDESLTGKLTHSSFHTVNRTSGFSTVDYGQLESANTSVTSALMFIGGVSASTAAGIKVNTLMVIAVATYAILGGRQRVKVFGREIPRLNVLRAFTVGASGVFAVLLLIMALFVVQPELDYKSAVFEIVSAFGTVGWSTGVTPRLNDAALIVVSTAMFVGRFGPLTIALFMAGREREPLLRYPQQRVRIG